MGARDYRVLTPIAAASRGGKLLHLVREDAESSLCGIPRSVLDHTNSDLLMCSDCIDWLSKRVAVTGRFKPVNRP